MSLDAKAVVVYRSKLKLDMYLFVAAEDDLARVPEELMRRFGRPEKAMDLELHTEKRLARTDAATVLRALDQQGFYLQLPPVDSAGQVLS